MEPKKIKPVSVPVVCPSVCHEGFPGGASGKESTCPNRRHGFDPWVGKIPWRRKRQPTQFSCLENLMDRGAWRVIVHGVTQSRTGLKQLSLHVPFEVILFFSVLVTRKRRLHGVKYLDLEQHDGAEIHTWGRVALMLCCLAMGGKGGVATLLWICKPKAETHCRPHPQHWAVSWVGSMQTPNTTMGSHLKTVSLIEQPPWFPKFNQAWNSFLLLKNPMSPSLFFMAMLCSMREPSSPTRDRTHVHCIGSMEL